MTDFFTSDTHFGHSLIIEICNRPFRDADHMEEALRTAWNARVGKNDRVFHLGDFSFGDQQNQQYVLDSLNGEKHLIIGNHDRKSRHLLGWSSTQYYKEIKSDDQRIILSHYAMRVWNGSHWGSLMLYGHSHGNLPGNSQSCDVGVDVWDYTPVTLDAIRARLVTLLPYTGYAEQSGGTDHHKLIKHKEITE